MSTAAVSKAPTPANVDELAEKFQTLQAALTQKLLELAEAQRPIGPLKNDLIEMLREFGSTHAEKSKILHGIVWEMMGTFGSCSSIDAAAVERFRLALVKSKQARLLKRIFQQDIRWTLSPGSSKIILGAKLSPKLLGLYALCQSTKEKTPSLDVRKKRTE